MNKPKEFVTDRIRRKANVEIETVPRDSDKVIHAKKLLGQAADLLTNDLENEELIGIGVVFAYGNKTDAVGVDARFKTLLIGDNDKFNQVLASLAVDQLRKKAMTSFGRSVNRDIW